jgi:proteasome assembly chaperone 2
MEFQRNTLALQIPFIPGGGLTRRILSSISTSKWEIPVASLVHFAMEGDNRADAGLLASVVAKVLGIEVPQWKQPGSWHVGLFGTPSRPEFIRVTPAT